MDELIDQIHQSPKAPGVHRIYVAGEIEYDLESARRTSGVPLEDSVFEAPEESTLSVNASCSHGD
jgi:LDH2 family malate/lactate/ureidoglycolate dehydrogenase